MCLRSLVCELLLHMCIHVYSIMRIGCARVGRIFFNVF